MHCRICLILLALVLLVGAVTNAFAAVFNDAAGTPYQTAFESLQSNGVISGYNDGTVRPNSYLNRSEALKIILEADSSYGMYIAWYRKNMPPISLFHDVDQRMWFAPYVEVGFQHGVIAGYRDGTFRPATVLTVEEAIAMLIRASYDEELEDEARLSEHIENRSGEWFTPYVSAAVEKNLIMHRGTLRLGQPITRGQFADMVYRMKEVNDQSLVAFNGEEPEVAPVVRARPVVSSVSTPAPVAAYEPSDSSGNNDVTLPSLTFGPDDFGVIRLDSNQSTAVSTTRRVQHQYASEKFFAVSMPSLGIEDLAIIHPEDSATKDGVLAPLKDGVGHLFSYPGGGGKIMIYGHSSSYPWDVSEYTKIFRRVNELETGDKIYVTYAGDLYVYEVVLEQTIQASDTAPFKDDGTGEELILYTCWPPDSIAQRYLVHAVPVETIAGR